MLKLKGKMLVLGFLLSIFCGCVAAQEKEMPKEKTMKENPFYMGVYVYDYAIKNVAKERNRDFLEFFEEQFDILQKNGVNAMYLSGNNDRELFGEYLKLSEKYGIKLIPQLDFAYFRPGWDDKQMRTNAEKAGKFISKYINSPQILAWTVKEEILSADINKLARYYSMIREYAPDAKFCLHYSQLGTAEQPAPDSEILGTNRYAFYWTSSGGGYLASPAFALNWLRNQAAIFQEKAAQRGADFMLTITDGGAQGYRKAKSLDLDKKLDCKIKKYAEEGRMGWGKTVTPEDEFYYYWEYYRTPGNCMKAQAWIGVLEGARLFFCWSFTPPTKATANATVFDFMLSKEKVGRLWTLAGHPGKPNPQLAEFKEASREIRRYERIITRMYKLPASPVLTNEKQFYFNRAFSFPELKGKIIVIHNGNVGTWPENSAYHFKEDADIRIDTDGNLVGYKPLSEPMEAKFEVTDLDSSNAIFDIESGNQIKNTDGGYSVNIMPGSGKLLFIGTSEELKVLRQLMP